jgi:hypothetical protein
MSPRLAAVVAHGVFRVLGAHEQALETEVDRALKRLVRTVAYHQRRGLDSARATYSEPAITTDRYEWCEQDDGALAFLVHSRAPLRPAHVGFVAYQTHSSLLQDSIDSLLDEVTDHLEWVPGVRLVVQERVRKLLQHKLHNPWVLTPDP